ncbi:transcriptional regulator [Enterococcus sp. AZ012]|uniref:transcriptional regulator n=1 Tax=unclassified Enterococcus TaxID=2608891 RepID=UPI003D2E12A7
MELFDVAKYQLPKDMDIEWETTKKRFSVFLSEYKNIREKVGIPATPRIQETYSVLHRENVSPEVLNDPLYKEFEYLHRLFIKGYLSINHPYKPEITDRRRKIFLLRYFYGLSIPLVSERVHYQKNIILIDSKKSLIQFTSAIHLLEQKQE